jgi:hypothetical protein
LNSGNNKNCGNISKVSATARLGADPDFFENDRIPRGELDDVADLLDDHLNNALDGLFTDVSDSCSMCSFSLDHW